jgi:hypothetical protein
MVSENAFTEKDKRALEETPLRSEMAVPSEWVVREEARPDELLTVFVAPSDHFDELQAACSCLRGAQDLTCPHALDVFNQIRANEHILVQLFKRRNVATA